MADPSPRGPYAGRRTVPGPVPSLKDFVARVISSNISSLTDVGDVPFALVRQFLTDVPAAQLAQIELHSPAIRSESKALWKPLALRDFFELRLAYEKGAVPEPKNWRTAYIMANGARREKEAAGRERLRAGYAALESEKAGRGLVRDVSLREPVKKSRFGGTETNPRRPSSSVLSKARSLTKSSLNAFKQPVSASSAASAKKPLPTPKEPTYKPTAPTAIARRSQPTTDPAKRFTLSASSSSSASAKAKAREIVVRKGVYVAPTTVERSPAVRGVDFFKRPPPVGAALLGPSASKKREVNQWVSSDTVSQAAFPDDQPLPLPEASPSPPLAHARPTIQTPTAQVSPVLTQPRPSPRTASVVPLTPSSAAAPRGHRPSPTPIRDLRSPPAVVPSPSAASPPLPPPPAQSRAGGSSRPPLPLPQTPPTVDARQALKRKMPPLPSSSSSLPLPAAQAGNGLWIPSAKRRKSAA